MRYEIVELQARVVLRVLIAINKSLKIDFIEYKVGRLEFPSLEYLGTPVDGMRLLCRCVVLFVYLDGLVRLRGDEPGPGLVEGHREDPGFRVHRARLDSGLTKQFHT